MKSKAPNQERGLEIDWFRPKSGDADMLPMRILYHTTSDRRLSDYSLLLRWAANAIGLMQICPKAHSINLREVGIEEHEVYSIDHNIHLGCMILRKYYDETRSIALALAKLVEDDTHIIIHILVSFTNTVITDRTKEIHEESLVIEQGSGPLFLGFSALVNKIKAL